MNKSTKGLLFPGQGSQAVGMGEALYGSLPAAKAVLDKANEILDYDIRGLIFNGPEEKLTDTRYAQPAIFICSAMYLELAKAQNIDYDYVAGHSLGEYSALYAADMYDFEVGLKLVAARGEAMSRMNGRGMMTAVIGLDEEELKEYLQPGVVMANLNTKKQIVISGSSDGIKATEDRLKYIDDIKCTRLNVSAAFHSPQMHEAAGEMKRILDAAELREPICQVVSNVTGAVSNDSKTIKENLINQITGQVRWYDTIMTLKEAGVEILYEVGQGKILSKMNKGITMRPKCVPLSC